jgi:hypothetical protein
MEVRMQLLWHREHHLADGHIVRISSVSPDDGRCRAAVYLDEFTDSGIYITCEDGTAQAWAEAVVQKAYPHDCGTYACSEWTLEQPLPTSRSRRAASH